MKTKYEERFDRNGSTFHIEPSTNFDDRGRFIPGHGVFLNLIRNPGATEDSEGLGWFANNALAREYVTGQ